MFIFILCTVEFVRLKPEVEKQELELFKQGQFVIEDEEKEDASAPSTDRPLPPDIPPEVGNLRIDK